MLKIFLGLLSVIIISCTKPATSPTSQEVISLYNGKAPGSENWDWKEVQREKSIWGPAIAFNITNPTLTVYRPPAGKDNGVGMIIAPGGGFFFVSVEEEGKDVAKWLNDLGITVFMLKYRVVHSKDNDPNSGFMSLLSKDSANTWKQVHEVGKLAGQDGLKAMEHVRSNASKYNLNKNKIGFMGFSAGGAVTLSVLYQAEEKNRPNFAASIYGAEIWPLNAPVPQQKTPIFLAAASNDPFNVVPISLSTYQKWLKAKQSAELHIYESGGHGFGVKKQNLPSDAWTKSFEDWLRFNKIIPRTF
jgi:acetyl esterase/lipase